VLRLTGLMPIQCCSFIVSSISSSGGAAAEPKVEAPLNNAAAQHAFRTSFVIAIVITRY
jgi:hypothetical protein